MQAPNGLRSRKLTTFSFQAVQYLYIVGALPLIKGGGRTFQKLSHLGGGGVRNFLLEREDKPEKGGGLM